MTISVHPAAQEDAEDLADLMAELDAYYGATPVGTRNERTAQIRGLIFGPTPAAHVLLAGDDRRLVGMAAYSYLWPAAGVTHSLYLKELYVTEAARRRGVGRLLMDCLRAIAEDQRCSRLEWTTDRDNAGAQAFYKALGVEVNGGKVFYRIALSP